MEYIYIISNIFLLISALAVKNKPEKMNFIPTSIIIIVLYFCYNAMIAYLLNIVHLPINLTSMLIVNTITTIILWSIPIIKNRKIEIQTYRISIKEVIFLGILLLLNVPILYQEFGLLDNFRYISTDATMHAGVAKKFYETQELVTSLEGIEAVNPTFLIGGYVNLGMLFQTFAPIIGEFNLYKLYILFDIIIYLLIGIVFYYLLKKYAKGSKTKEIIAGILTIVYMIGYPLNSLITGFHYFALGILQVLSILYVLGHYGKNKTLPALFLLNTGILLTYNLFAPVVYIIEAIVMTIYHKKETGKVINKKIIQNMAITMLVPGLIGISFFILPRVFGNIQLQDAQNLNVDGYIYINYWSNILPFLPLVIYGIYQQVREKKCTEALIALMVMESFTALFFIGKQIGKISTYYYMKNYYILMAFIIIVAFQGISYLAEKRNIGKWIVGILTGSYIFVMAYNLVFVQVGPYDFTKNPDKSVMDIYNSNKAIMKYIQALFPKERLEALAYMEEHQCIKGQNTLLISNHIDEHLLQFFFHYQNRKNLNLPNITEEIEEWNKGNYEYLIVFQKDLYLQKYEQIKSGNIVFEKEEVVVYKR